MSELYWGRLQALPGARSKARPYCVKMKPQMDVSNHLKEADDEGPITRLPRETKRGVIV